MILILMRIIQNNKEGNAEISSTGLVPVQCGSRNAHQEVVFAKGTL